MEKKTYSKPEIEQLDFDIKEKLSGPFDPTLSDPDGSGWSSGFH